MIQFTYYMIFSNNITSFCIFHYHFAMKRTVSRFTVMFGHSAYKQFAVSDTISEALGLGSLLMLHVMMELDYNSYSCTIWRMSFPTCCHIQHHCDSARNWYYYLDLQLWAMIYGFIAKHSILCAQNMVTVENYNIYWFYDLFQEN